MSLRRALIIDRSEQFSGLLRRTLEAVHMEAEVVENGKEGLVRISEHDPDIVFLSVERPKKKGFSLFTQIKSMINKTPIVISSSTLPMDELLLHQKLRLHADAYLDKRNLEESHLLRTLNGLLELGLDASELAEATSRAIASAENRVGDGDARTEVGTLEDNEITAALASLEASVDETLTKSPSTACASQPVDQDSSTVSDPASPADALHLQQELKRAQAELETVRRSASSSPFSAEYIELREKAVQSDRKLARLQSDIERLTGELKSSEMTRSALKQELTTAAQTLVETQKDRDTTLDRANHLERRLEFAQEELRKAGAKIETLERDLAQIVETNDERKRQYAERLEELKRKHASEIVALERKHDQALAASRARCEEEKREAVAGVEKTHEECYEAIRREYAEALAALREDHRKDVERHEVSHRKKLADLEEQHRQSMATERARFQERLAKRDAESKKALEARDREAATALQQATDERKRDRAAAESQRLHQLECAENKHRSELEEIESRHRVALSVARDNWQTEMEATDARRRAEIEALHQRYQSRIDQLVKDRQDAEAAAQKHAARASQAYDKLLRETRQSGEMPIRQRPEHATENGAEPHASEALPDESIDASMFDDILEFVNEADQDSKPTDDERRAG